MNDVIQMQCAKLVGVAEWQPSLHRSRFQHSRQAGHAVNHFDGDFAGDLHEDEHPGGAPCGARDREPALHGLKGLSEVLISGHCLVVVGLGWLESLSGRGRNEWEDWLLPEPVIGGGVGGNSGGRTGEHHGCARCADGCRPQVFDDLHDLRRRHLLEPARLALVVIVAADPDSGVAGLKIPSADGI